MFKLRLSFSLITLLYCLAGCVTTQTNYVHICLKEAPKIPPPKKILLIPVDITVSELSAGGAAEEVPDWSQTGKELVSKHVYEYILTQPQLEIIEAPVFTEEEQNIIDQHLALYDLVAGSILSFKKEPAWQHKYERPDGTLGPGLAFLREKTGADAALIVFGQDFVSSGGRVATAVFAAVWGVVVPMGYAYLNVGVIDLKTGNLLWTDTAVTTTETLKIETGATRMVTRAFQKFPDFSKLTP